MNDPLPPQVIQMQKNKLDLDTHKNDGTIGLLYHHLINNNDISCPTSITKDNVSNGLLSFDQSIELIENWLKESISQEKDKISRAINLLKTDKNGNFDRINNIHVEELLPRVIDIVQCFESSGRESFLTMLGEIIELGSCSQGRTIRLLSYYIPFKT